MGMVAAILNVDASHRGDEEVPRDHKEDLVGLAA